MKNLKRLASQIQFYLRLYEYQKALFYCVKNTINLTYEKILFAIFTEYKKVH